MWKFKQIVRYGNLITKDSRIFEYLVKDYLNDIYPLENWEITKATGDGNRDVESVCELTGNSMWAEAKYTIHSDEALSSRKYDSTLVSSLEFRSLIKVYFVTNAHISESLTERIKNFYYLTETKKVSFIDGRTLYEWIKRNPEIEIEYFDQPLPHMTLSSKEICVTSLRMICMGDSYVPDAVSDQEEGFFLFTAKNYNLEINIRASGFYKEPVKIKCNDKIIYDDVLSTEHFTCTIPLDDLFENIQTDIDYGIEIAYIIDEDIKICQNTSVTFVSLGRQFEPQAKIYNILEKYVKYPSVSIINIYGQKNTGKSWVLQNLKNDLLKKPLTGNQRIIYINFSGLVSDISDICRFLFTLMLDYSSIDISEISLQKYCSMHKASNTLLSEKILNDIIIFIQDNNYSELQKLLSGAICSNTEKIFSPTESFPLRRIYFIDNIHMLSTQNREIFDAIINAYRNNNTIMFLTDRMEANYSNCSNEKLEYIDNAGVKRVLREELPIIDTTEADRLADADYLRRPGLFYNFLKTGKKYQSAELICQYYDNEFQTIAERYDKGKLDFSNPVLLLVCFIYWGIPNDYFYSSDFDVKMVSKLINGGYLIVKDSIIYPNISIWDEKIPESILTKMKSKLIRQTNSLIDFDKERAFFYKLALAKNYAEFYSKYFSELYKIAEKKFFKNNYADAFYISRALLCGPVACIGNLEELNSIKYWYAFSSMHYDSSVNAIDIFSSVKDSYGFGDFKSPLYYNAYAEILDALYWSHSNYMLLPAQIRRFQRTFTESESVINKDLTRAYLTAMNRMMVTYLAMDKYGKAEKWLRKNIRFAVSLNHEEHIGYCFMDFAKGIYHIDLQRALEYLQYADTFFKNNKKEVRRHLDCLCEIEYVKFLLEHKSMKGLFYSQAQLYNHGYWIQYYKGFLKIAVCQIISGKFEDALQNILQAQRAIPVKTDERVQYLCHILYTYLDKKPTKYVNECLCGTYKKILDISHKSNLERDGNIIYSNKTKAERYVIDPRAW